MYPIIVALDFSNEKDAIELVDKLDPTLCRVKVGKELFTSSKIQIIDVLSQKGFEVFLDLKFHDIPSTTAMAVKAATNLGVWMVSIHCFGGFRMMLACRKMLDSFTGKKPLLIGISVMTSIDSNDLIEIGVVDPHIQVLRLAKLAEKAGMDGLVCSPTETSILKENFPNFKIINPGIRPFPSKNNDHIHTISPRQALHLGADYLVIGRPIIRSNNPAKVLDLIISEL